MKKIVLCLLTVMVLCMTACGSADTVTEPNDTKAPETTVAESTGDVVVQMPVASRENGVISAEEWSEMFPEIYASYMANAENSDAIDHVEEYPQIAKIYEGMAFNTYYNSARGHVYTLEDVTSTGRPHPLSNCLTCKTPDYTALVNANGVSTYKLTFEEVSAQVVESISCYNCHANEAADGSLVVTHQYLSNAMGEDASKINAATLSCAQCHNEYYFDPETKATTLPYSGLEAIHPDSILEYYNTMGFADYTNPRTGTPQIKVQHPEFETFMGEGSKHSSNMSCASCHMGTTTSAEGVTYVDHEWTSPLDNEELIKNTCSACHTDLEADVKAIQKEAEDRTVAIADQLVILTDKLADAVASGDYTEDELNAIRGVHRDAQFYWDFVFVENSEGAHNSALTKYCLDQAETLCKQALGMFK